MSWHERAACHQHPESEAFFGDERSQKNIAITVCRTCPVVDECLQHALDERETEGVWGGTTPDQRKDLLRRRRRAS